MAGLTLVVVGMQVFIIQPGMVTALIHHGRMTAERAGYAISAEMFGIAIATIAMAVVGARIGWRVLGMLAMVTLAAADLAAALGFDGSGFIFIRIVAGLASGIAISIGYAVAGRSTDPDRAFGILTVAVLCYGAAGISALPGLAEAFGMSGIFLILAGMAVIGLILVRELPSESVESERRAPVSAGPLDAKVWFAISAVFLFFFGQGMVWVFLSVIGERMGIASQNVANAITIGKTAGVCGAMAAAVIGKRFGHAPLLAIGTLGCVLPLAALAGRLGWPAYTLSLCVFLASSNLMTPLVLAVVAGFDSAGTLVQRAVALQMIALAAGPALATLLLARGFGIVMSLAGLMFILCWLLGTVAVVTRARTDEAVSMGADPR